MKIIAETVAQARKFAGYLNEMSVSFYVSIKGTWESDGGLVFADPEISVTSLSSGRYLSARVDGKVIPVWMGNNSAAVVFTLKEGK